MLTMLVPASSGGVTDYANNIGINFHSNECKIIPTTRSTSLAIENIFLHYSGYGFSNRGAPLWLMQKLRKEKPKNQMLGICFHELYASGPPWGSAFWLSPVQRHIARSLAEMSDFWITNREGSAQWLRRFAGGKPHAVLPVFSNVGEMSAYSPDRAQKIVVFGSAGLRTISYRATGEDLFRWAHEQGLELHDIGPPIDDPLIKALMVRAGVIEHGRLEAAEVSVQLSNAMFGVVAYPVDYVAKSGVFAAYCAHGVCPLLISKNYDSVDELVAGNNYFSGLPLIMIKNSEVQNIGSAAWKWYQPHSVAAHMATLRRLTAEANI